MAEERNLFKDIDEIKAILESDKKPLKNLSELPKNLSELPKSLSELPKSLSDRLKTKDPELIRFLEKADLIWKYTGDKKIRKKEYKTKKRNLIILGVSLLVELALMIICSVLASNYVLISLFVNLALTFAYLYMCFSDYRAYNRLNNKIKYDELPKTPFVKFEEDENGIAFPDKRVLPMVIKISMLVFQLFIVVAFMYVGIVIGSITFILVSVLGLVLEIQLSVFQYRADLRWQLSFTDKENEFSYSFFEEFITDNNIKLNIKK